MAKMVELSFDIRGVLDSGFSAAFHNAGRLMQDLQNKSSSLSKTVSQVGNYKKLEDGIKADQAALADMSAKSADLNSKLQAVSSQTAILKTQFNAALGEALSSQAALNLSRERYAAIAEEVARLKHELNVAPSDELKRRLSAAEVEAVKLGNAVARDTARFKEADSKAKNLNKSLKNSESQQKALTRESQNLAGKTERLQQSLQRKKSALDELHPSLQKAGIDTRNLAAEQERLTKKSQQFAASQSRLQEAQAKYTAARQQLSFGNLKGELVSSLASFEILKQPLKVAADFEHAMARVDAVVFGGKNDLKKSAEERAQFAALKTQAENLGATTQYTASQAAATQEVLARANFKTPEILNMTPAIMDMAAADGMELSQAGSILAGVLRSFSLDSKEAARVADVLAKGSVSADTNISELGEALKYVAPVTKQLKIPLEDTIALIDLLADARIKGSEAGHALRSSLLRITEQPKALAEALKELKISVFDKNGRLRELPGLFADIMKATEKMGEGKRMGIIGRAFGKENATTILTLMEQSVAIDKETGKTGAERKIDEIYAARGTAHNMAEVMNNNYVGDTTKFSSAMEGLFNRVGGEFLEPMRWITQKLTDSVSSFTGFLNENPAASKATAIGTAGVAGWSFFKLATKVAAGVKDLMAASAQIHAATAAAETAATAGTITTAATTATTTAATTAGTTAASTATTTGTTAAGSGGILSALGLAALYSLSAGVIAAGIHGMATNDKNFREATKNFSVLGTEIGGWGALADRYKPVDAKNIQDAEAMIKNESINKILDAAIEQKNKSAGFMDTVTPVINELNIQEKLTAKRDEIAQWSSQLIESMRNSEYAIKDLPERLRPILELLRDQSTPIMIIQDNAPSRVVMPSWSKSPFINGGISAHASGGIFSTPHIGLVAEAGKEAIVPLENKTRGIPLWLAAGEEMGFSFGGASYSVNNNTNKPEYIFNITVNGDSTGESEIRMRRMIVDVLREIEEREAMVSFI